MSGETFFLRPLGNNRSVGVRLEPGRQIVGRDRSCDIVLTDESISRRHAELTVCGRSVHVRDLDSRNGTFLDHRPVVEADAQVGSRLGFANVEFQLAIADEELPETGDPGLDEAAGNQPAIVGLLSDAQRRVFERLLQGMSEKEIASSLLISRHTVHRHVCRIYELAQVNSRPELLALFVNRPTLPAPRLSDPPEPRGRD